MFSSNSFMVTGLTFRPLSHFEFIFINTMRECFNLVFWAPIQFSQYRLWVRLSYLHCIVFHPFSPLLIGCDFFVVIVVKNWTAENTTTSPQVYSLALCSGSPSVISWVLWALRVAWGENLFSLRVLWICIFPVKMHVFVAFLIPCIHGHFRCFIFPNSLTTVALEPYIVYSMSPFILCPPCLQVLVFLSSVQLRFESSGTETSL